nr:flagellar export chaperone FliS [Thalassobacillus sp. C254]
MQEAEAYKNAGRQGQSQPEAGKGGAAIGRIPVATKVIESPGTVATAGGEGASRRKGSQVRAGNQTASASATNQYKQNALQTASPGELTMLLYNACLTFIKKGKHAIEEGDAEARNKFVSRAQDIIRELMVTLKTDSEVGQSMLQMYDFIHHRLVEANINNDAKALDEAEQFVADFRDTWKEVIKLDRQHRHNEGGQI